MAELDGRGLHVGLVADRHLGQHLCLRNIRDDHRGNREETADFLGDCVVRGKTRPTCGHHDRVDHDVRGLVVPEFAGDGFHRFNAHDDADLHGGGSNIVENRIDLGAHDAGVHGGDGLHAGRVLRRDARHHAFAEYIIGEHRLEVGGNAGTAGGVGCGDREHGRQLGCSRLASGVPGLLVAANGGPVIDQTASGLLRVGGAGNGGYDEPAVGLRLGEHGNVVGFHATGPR